MSLPLVSLCVRVLGGADAPTVGAAGEIPAVTDMGVSGELPAASVDVGGSLPSGEAGASVPSVEGLKGSADDLAADVGAKVDDLAAKDLEMPSVDLKKPKKGLFSVRSFKRPSLRSKGKAEVRRARMR